MDIISKLYNRAKQKHGKIILPEALLDERVMNACKMIVADQLSELVLLGK